MLATTASIIKLNVFQMWHSHVRCARCCPALVKNPSCVYTSTAQQRATQRTCERPFTVIIHDVPLKAGTHEPIMSVSQSEPTLSADNDVSADIDGSSVLALTVEIPIISHTSVRTFNGHAIRSAIHNNTALLTFTHCNIIIVVCISFTLLLLLFYYY